MRSKPYRCPKPPRRSGCLLFVAGVLIGNALIAFGYLGVWLEALT